MLLALSGCNIHFHDYSDATCTYPKICESCGEVSGEALGHDFSKATCTSASTCARCGWRNGTALGHNYVYGKDATCTSHPSCTRCGSTSSSTLGHEFIDATCTSPRICARCSSVSQDALGHDYSSATCTSPQICKRCEDVKGNSLGHSFSEATCTTDKTCVRCNSVVVDTALGHTYAENICIRCNQVDPESLPVGFDKLYVINSQGYRLETGNFTDTFGNTYNGSIHLYQVGGILFDVFSLHNLNGKYSAFTGSIVAGNNMKANITVEIYVDDELAFSKSNFNRETGKIDFEINVENASTVRIVTSKTDSIHIAIVNAELTK